MRNLIFSFILFVCSNTVVEAQITEEMTETTKQMFQNYKRRFENKSRVTGYRIQLFTGNKQTADRIRAQYMQLNHPYPIYMVFEMPNYKIQVGDFRDRLEAEGARESLMNSFNGAFLVKSPITPHLKIATN